MFERLAHFRNLTTGIHGPFRPEPGDFDISWSSYNPSRKGLDQSLRLRLDAAAFELSVATLELELQAPPLPLEGGESGEHPGQGHLMDDPPPAGGGGKKKRKGRAA